MIYLANEHMYTFKRWCRGVEGKGCLLLPPPVELGLMREVSCTKAVDLGDDLPLSPWVGRDPSPGLTFLLCDTSHKGSLKVRVARTSV